MRVGVFGGTFDPPHLAHLAVAQDALEALRLDRVLFVPAGEPPHKQGAVRTPAATRVEMTRAAIAGDPRFELDDRETHRTGPSFTVDTLRELERERPGTRLVLLIGADQYREFDTWREPEEILRLAELGILTRLGAGAPAAELGATSSPDVTGAEREAGGAAAGRRHLVQVTRLDLSSTELRRRAAAGASLRYLVPPAVEAIIRRDGLYAAPAAGWTQAGGAG